MPDANATKGADGGLTYRMRGMIFDPPCELLPNGPDQAAPSPLVELRKAIALAVKGDWNAYRQMFDPKCEATLQDFFGHPEVMQAMAKQYAMMKSIKAQFGVYQGDILLVVCTLEAPPMPAGCSPYGLEKMPSGWVLYALHATDPLVPNIMLGTQAKAITVSK